MKKFKVFYTIEREIILEAKDEDNACDKFWNSSKTEEADRIEEVEEIV